VYANSHVGRFTFTTPPQDIAVGAVSEQITIEAQDVSGSAVNGHTVCIHIVSSSPTGEFSTNAENWSAEPVRTLVLTLSSNQYRRNLYYKDSTDGSHTLTVQAALRPEDLTCPNWSPNDGIEWSATQIITVGSGSQNTSPGGGGVPADTNTGTASGSSSLSSESIARVSAGSDRTVVVGADVRFEGVAYNSGSRLVEDARFVWSFGDGTAAEGKAVTHRFEHPGRYAVVLEASRGGASVSHRITVTAEIIQLSFTALSDGGVSVANLSGRDMDLSNWRVFDRFTTFKFPLHTILLRGASIRLTPATLRFHASSLAELQYPNGETAMRALAAIDPASESDIAVEQTLGSASNDEEVISSISASTTSEAAGYAGLFEAPTHEPEDSLAASLEEDERLEGEPAREALTPTREPERARNVAAAAAGAASGGLSLLWWLGMLLVVALGTVAVFAARRLRRPASSAPGTAHVDLKDWNIIEEEEERQ